MKYIALCAAIYFTLTCVFNMLISMIRVYKGYPVPRGTDSSTMIQAIAMSIAWAALYYFTYGR